jgi:hypothetical protein
MAPVGILNHIGCTSVITVVITVLLVNIPETQDVRLSISRLGI